MKSWVAILSLVVIVVVDALPSTYPIYPGIGAIYKGPNSETIVKGPDGSIITAEADGAQIGLNLESAPIVVKESRPEAILVSEVRREPIVISEEIVSKINGPNLIVGKIAQPLSLEGNVAASTTERNIGLLSPSSARGPIDNSNRPVTYGGGYGAATIPKSRTNTNDVTNTQVDFRRPVIQEPGPLGDGHIYPPVMFDNPDIAELIPDGPVIVDEQIARDHLIIGDGPLYHPGTGALYNRGPGPIYRPAPGPAYPPGPEPALRPVLPDRRLRPPIYEYARYSPTVVIKSGPAITRFQPVLTTIPLASVLDTAPIYVAPKFIPGVALAKDTVSTISESRIDVLQPSPYLSPPTIKEPIIVNKW